MEGVISADLFESKFKPMQNHIDNNASYEGAMFETFGAELEYVWEVHKTSPNRVWTVCDGDNGPFIGSGFDYVNRLGFIITEIPFEGEGFLEVNNEW